MDKLKIWLRQPSTISALAWIAAGVIAGLSQVFVGNVYLTILAALIVRVATGLGIDDNTAQTAAVAKLTEDAVKDIVSKKIADDVPVLINDAIVVAQNLAPLVPMTTASLSDTTPVPRFTQKVVSAGSTQTALPNNPGSSTTAS